MGTPSMSATPRSPRRARVLLGWVLLGFGLLGHLLAARAIGGSYVAFRDHIGGFLILTVVSAAIIGGLGWRFWRGRRDISWVSIGAVQAILGAVVYLQRFRVHG
jgi:hypothetical protein